MEPLPDRAQIRAAESRIEYVIAGAFSVLVLGTLWYVHSLFAEIAPIGKLWAWTAMILVVAIVMAVIPIHLSLRKPNDAEMMRIWAPVGKVVAVSFDLAVASSVWLLLPYASEPLRLLMVILYSAVISGQVISAAESLETIAFGVITIFGSAAVFFLLSPGPYSAGLAIFLLAYGALMIGVAAVLKVAVRSAIVAQLRAEAVSARLGVALDEATEARESKTRFIAAATHDLRQPLQAAAVFFNRVIGPDRSKDDQAVTSARLAFEEAASLLDRLLDHLKLDGGLIQPAMGEVDLDALLARVHAEMEPLAAASGVTIRRVRTSLRVEGDPHLIHRMLRNLLHNALRHSRGERIVIGVRQTGDRVRLFVVDDGRGVPDAMLGTLFNDTPGDVRRASGVGLGLSSSRKLAELMGGTVQHVPRWRRGAAFYVELERAG